MKIWAALTRQRDGCADHRRTCIVQTATRRMRIRVGDVLRGVEGDVTSTIEVMYLGVGRRAADKLIICHTVRETCHGVECKPHPGEQPWTLACRDWQRVKKS